MNNNNQILNVVALVCGNRILIIEETTQRELNIVSTGYELARFCNDNACRLVNRNSFTSLVTDRLFHK